MVKRVSGQNGIENVTCIHNGSRAEDIDLLWFSTNFVKGPIWNSSEDDKKNCKNMWLTSCFSDKIQLINLCTKCLLFTTFAKTMTMNDAYTGHENKGNRLTLCVLRRFAQYSHLPLTEQSDSRGGDGPR